MASVMVSHPAESLYPAGFALLTRSIMLWGGGGEHENGKNSGGDEQQDGFVPRPVRPEAFGSSG